MIISFCRHIENVAFYWAYVVNRSCSSFLKQPFPDRNNGYLDAIHSLLLEIFLSLLCKSSELFYIILYNIGVKLGPPIKTCVIIIDKKSLISFCNSVSSYLTDE